MIKYVNIVVAFSRDSGFRDFVEKEFTKEKRRMACDNKKKADIVKRDIAFAIEATLVFVMGMIILISLLKPRDNLFSWQMSIGSIVFCVLILGGYLIWINILVYRIGIWNDYLFIGGTIFYTIFLYGISITGRNSASSLVDYYCVYCTAEEMAAGIKDKIWNYFLIYSNNFKPAMYLGELFSFAEKYLGLQDPYYFALLFTVIQVPCAIVSARYLSGNTTEQRRKYQCPILLLFVAFFDPDPQ